MSSSDKPTYLADGVYVVIRPNFVAGFQVRAGRLEGVAPILRRKIDYWVTQAERVGPLPSTASDPPSPSPDSGPEGRLHLPGI